MEERMTLRDKFAMAALPSIIEYLDRKASELPSRITDNWDLEQICCEKAYEIADKMMTQRDK
ncbi:MAG TPA: hypothetical protein VLB84_13695 [Bacteroidia bacterium]|nr:hypothetical protein [Bacteroidia bacterium]